MTRKGLILRKTNQLTEEQKGCDVSLKMRTVRPCVRSSAVFNSFTLNRQNILTNKMKRKETNYIFYTSVLLSFTAIAHQEINGFMPFFHEY